MFIFNSAVLGLFFVAALLQSLVHISRRFMELNKVGKVGHIDYQNGESGYLKKSQKYEPVVSLKDVPLEIRRKEAEKPLFIVRYE